MENGPNEDEPPPIDRGDDPEVKEAQPKVRQLFRDAKRRPKKATYYKRQIQVLLEGDYFPWIVSDALKILVEKGDLTSFEMKSKYQEKIIFYHDGSFTTEPEKNRIRSRAKRICSLIDKMSNPNLTKALGDQLEGLVKAELRAQRFEITGTNTNTYQGKTWTESGHDLDFIAEHDSGRLTVGVEVKNTLDIVPKKELEIKLRMCKFLEITPVFAVRWNTPYLNDVYKAGGYTWTFKTQIYPPGNVELTKELFKRLGLPVIVRTELPPKPVRLFHNWVEVRTRKRD